MDGQNGENARAFKVSVLFVLARMLLDGRRDVAPKAFRDAAVDRDADIRRVAAYGMGETGQPQDIGQLERMLFDEDASVRAEAACSLGRIGGLAAGKALARCFADSDAEVRTCAVFGLIDAVSKADAKEKEAFRTIVEDAARLLEDADRDVRMGAALLFSEIGDSRAREALVQGLGDKKWMFDAARALGKLGDRTAVEPLRRVASRFFIHPLVRIEALRSLFLLGEQDAAAQIASRRRSRRLEERGYALLLSGELKLEGAFEELVSVLQDSGDFHRHTAARALGLLGDGRAVASLIEALDDEDEELREDAARSLGLIGEKRVAGKLKDVALKDRSEDVREAARAALEALNQ